MEAGSEQTDGWSEPPLSPSTMVRERVVYEVRVPVVFDHLNTALRSRVQEHHNDLVLGLGPNAAVHAEGLEFGKLEVWFKLDGDPVAEGPRQAADEGVRLVNAAVSRLGLDRSGDEPGLSVVDAQVLTTASIDRPAAALA